MSEKIALYRHGAVAEVVINRPEKMNAMTPEMSAALASLFAQLNDDDAVHVILLRGEGERAFSAGSDLRTLSSYRSAMDFRHRTDYGTTVRRARKPVVGAPKGWVLGGGLENDAGGGYPGGGPQRQIWRA